MPAVGPRFGDKATCAGTRDFRLFLDPQNRPPLAKTIAADSRKVGLAFSREASFFFSFFSTSKLKWPLKLRVNWLSNTSLGLLTEAGWAVLEHRAVKCLSERAMKHLADASSSLMQRKITHVIRANLLFTRRISRNVKNKFAGIVLPKNLLSVIRIMKNHWNKIARDTSSLENNKNIKMWNANFCLDVLIVLQITWHNYEDRKKNRYLFKWKKKKLYWMPGRDLADHSRFNWFI